MAAPALSPDAAPPRPDAAPLGLDAAPLGLDAASRADVAPDLAEPSDLGAPPAAPSACPELTAGWMEYRPQMSLQFEGSTGSGTGIASHPAGVSRTEDHCTYTVTGNVELFKMTKNPAGVRQRCEMRVVNGYKTGSQQFEGDVRITAGNGTSVHQIFKFLMLVAYPQNGGSLHQHSQNFLASGVFGKWVHVNTVHDTATGKADIYLDCVKKFTMNQNAPDASYGYYHKYGVYNLTSTAQAEWRNVRLYRK
jgi:hypothetical protein